MRSCLRLLPVLFFAALHAAALMLPDARAQTSDPDIALHAGWGEAGSRSSAQLTEGNTAFLTVRATAPSGTAPLRLQIEANSPLDANFSSSVILKGPEFSTKVAVAVEEDGNPEPREEVEFRVSAPDHPAAAPATAGLTIPRHGYEVNQLDVVPPLLDRDSETGIATFTVTAGLNGTEPASAVILFVHAEPVPAGEPTEMRMTIPAGASSATVKLGLNAEGFYAVSANRARFVNGAPLDQMNLAVTALRQIRKVFAPLKLELALEDSTLEEGGLATLTISVEGHLPTEQEQTVELSADPAGQIEFVGGDSVTLTAQNRSRLVRVRAVDDAAAERRQTVELSARAADLEASTSLVIARNGYEVNQLEVVPPLLDRDSETGIATFTVTAGLNGTEPASAAVLFVHAEPESGGEPTEMRMTIPAGASSATVKLGLDAEGFYTVSATRARFVNGAPLDQMNLAVTASPQIRKVFAPLELELALEDSTLEEGGLTTLRISVKGYLPAGREWTIELLANPAEQVQFIDGSSVILTALSRPWNHPVRVRATTDDAEAERRQTVELSARIVGPSEQAADPEASTSLVIARNGYRANAVTVAALEGDSLSEIESGGEFFLTLEMNGLLADEDRVELTLQTVHEHASGRATTTEILAFTKNDYWGQPGEPFHYRQRRALVRSGTYTWTVLDARFTNLKALDQEELLGREQLAPFSLRVTPPPLALQLTAQNLEQPGDRMREGGVAHWTLGARNLEDWLSATGATILTVSLEVLERDGDDLEDARLQSPAQVELSRSALTATVKVKLVDDALPEAGETAELSARAAGSTASAWAYIPRHDYKVMDVRLSAERAYGREPVYAIAQFNAPLPSAVALSYRMKPGWVAGSPVSSAYEGWSEALSADGRAELELGERYNFARGVYRFRLSLAGSGPDRGPGYFRDQCANGDQCSLLLADELHRKWLEYERVDATPTLEWQWAAGAESTQNWEASEGSTATLRLITNSLYLESPLRVELGLSHGEDVSLSTTAVILSVATPTAQVEVAILADDEPEPHERIEIRGSAGGVTFPEEAVIRIARHGYEVNQLDVVPPLLDRDSETGIATFTVTAGLNGTEPASAAVLFVHAKPTSDDEPTEMRMTIPAGASSATVKLGLDAEGVYTVSATRARFVNGAPLDQMNLAVTALRQIRKVFAPLELELALEDSTLEEGGLTTLRISVKGYLPAGREWTIELLANPAEQVQFIDGSSVILTALSRPWNHPVRVRAITDDAEAERRQTVELSARIVGPSEQAADPEASTSLVIARNGYRANAVTVAALEGDSLSEIESGGEFFLTLEMNGLLADEDRVELTLQTVHEDASGRATTTEILAFTQNNANRHGEPFYQQRRSLVRSGTYTWTVLDARFTNLKALDQEELLGREQLAPFSLRVTPPPLALQLTAQNLKQPGDWMREGDVAHWTLGARNLEDWLSATGATILTVSLEVLERDGDDLEDARLQSPAQVELSRSELTATVEVELINDALPEAGETAELSARAAGSTASAWAYIPRHDYKVIDVRLSAERAYGREPVYAIAQFNAPLPSAVALSYRMKPGWVAGSPVSSAYEGWSEALSADGRARLELGERYNFARGVYRFRLSLAGSGPDRGPGYFRDQCANGDQCSLSFADELHRKWLEYERVDATPTLEWQWAAGAESTRNWEASEGSTATLRLITNSLYLESPLRVELGLSHGEDVNLSTTAVILSVATPTAQVEVAVLEDGKPEPHERIEIRGSAGGVTFPEKAVIRIARHGYEVNHLDVVPPLLDRDSETGIATFTVTAGLNGTEPASAVILFVHAKPTSDDEPTEMRMTIPAGASSATVKLGLDAEGVYTVSATRARFVNGAPLDQMNLAVTALPQIRKVFAPLELELALEDSTLEEGGLTTLRISVKGHLPAGQEWTIELLANPAEQVQFIDGSSVILTALSRPWNHPVRVRAITDDAEAERRQTVELSARIVGPSEQAADPEASTSLVIARNGYRANAVTVAALGGDSLIASGGEFFLTLEMNGLLADEDQVELTLQTVHEDASGRTTTTETLAFTKNDANGHGGLFYRQRRSLTRSGTYIWTVLDARFTNLKALDQEELLGREQLAPFSLRVTPLALALELTSQNLRPRENWTIWTDRYGYRRWTRSLDLNPHRGWKREGSVARWTLSARNLEGWLSAAGVTTLTVSLEVLERDGDNLEDARLLSPAQVELSRSALTATVRVKLIDDALPEAGEEVELSARAAGTTASAWTYISRNDYQVTDFWLSTERAYGREPIYLTVQLNAPAPADVTVKYDETREAPGLPLPSHVSMNVLIEAFSMVGRKSLREMRERDDSHGVYWLGLRAYYRPVFLGLCTDGDQCSVPLAAGLEEKELRYERMADSPILESRWVVGAESMRDWEASEGSTATLTLRLSLDNLHPESPLRVSPLRLELGLSHEEDVSLSTTAVILSVATPTAQVEVAVLEDGKPESHERAVIEIRGLAGEVEFLEEAVIRIARHGCRVDAFTLWELLPGQWRGSGDSLSEIRSRDGFYPLLITNCLLATDDRVALTLQTVYEHALGRATTTETLIFTKNEYRDLGIHKERLLGPAWRVSSIYETPNQIELIRPGTYTWTVLDARFTNLKALDQEELLGREQLTPFSFRVRPRPLELRLTPIPQEGRLYRNQTHWGHEGDIARWTLSARYLEHWLSQTGVTTLTVTVSLEVLERDGGSLEDARLLSPAQVELSRSASTATVRVELIDDALPEAWEDVGLSARIARLTARTWTYIPRNNYQQVGNPVRYRTIIPRNDYQVTDIRLSTERAYGREPVYLIVQLNAPVSKRESVPWLDPVTVEVRYHIGKAVLGQSFRYSWREEMSIGASSATGRVELGRIYDFTRGVYRLRLAQEWGVFFRDDNNWFGDQRHIPLADGLEGKWLEYERVVVMPTLEWQWVAGAESTQNWEASEGSTATLQLSANGLYLGSPLRLELGLSHGEDVSLSTTAVILSVATPTALVEVEVLADDKPEPREKAVIEIRGLAGEDAFLEEAVIRIARNSYQANAVTVATLEGNSLSEIESGGEFFLALEMNGLLADEDRMELTLQTVHEHALGRAITTETLVFTKNNYWDRPGEPFHYRQRRALIRSGTYTWTVLDARFTDLKVLDQEELLGRERLAPFSLRVPLPQLTLELTPQNLNPRRGFWAYYHSHIPERRLFVNPNPHSGWMREGGIARWTLNARNLEDWLSATGATTLTVSLEVLEQDGDSLEDVRLPSPAQAELSRSVSTATVRVELIDDVLPEAGEEVELSARAAGSTASAWMYISRNDYQVADFWLSTERAYGREPVYLTVQLNAPAPSLPVETRWRRRVGFVTFAVSTGFRINRIGESRESGVGMDIEPLSATRRSEIGRLHDFTRGVYQVSAPRLTYFAGQSANGDQSYIPLADGLEEKLLEYERVGATPTLELQWVAGAEWWQRTVGAHWRQWLQWLPETELPTNARRYYWQASEGSTVTLRLSADSLRPESPLRVELGLSHREDVSLSTTAVILSVATPTAQVEVAVLEDGKPESYERAVIEIRGLAGEVKFSEEAVIRIARHGCRANAVTAEALEGDSLSEIGSESEFFLVLEMNCPLAEDDRAWLALQTVYEHASGRTTTREFLPAFTKNNANGHGRSFYIQRRAPVQPGTYTWTVLNPRFTSPGFLDRWNQEEFLGREQLRRRCFPVCGMWDQEEFLGREQLRPFSLRVTLSPLTLELTPQNLNPSTGSRRYDAVADRWSFLPDPHRNWMREGGVARWTLSARHLEGWLSATGATTLTVALEVLERDEDNLEDARLLSPAQVKLSRSIPTVTVSVELIDDALPEVGEEVELSARAAGTTASAWTYISRNDYKIIDVRLSAERAYGREPVYATMQFNAPLPNTVAVFYEISSSAVFDLGVAEYGIYIPALSTASSHIELGRIYDFSRGVYQFRLSPAMSDPDRGPPGYFLDQTAQPFNCANGDQCSLPLADGLRGKWLEYERVGATPTLEWQWVAGAESTQNWEASEGNTATLRLSADSLRPESPLRVELSHREDVSLSTTAVILSVATPTAQVEVEVLEDGKPELDESVVIEIQGLAGEVEFSEEAVIRIARNDYRANAFTVTALEGDSLSEIESGGEFFLTLEMNGLLVNEDRVELTLQTVHEHASGRATTTETLAFTQNNANGHGEPFHYRQRRTLVQPGTYTWTVLDARFTNLKALDQEELLGREWLAPFSLRVTQLALELTSQNLNPPRSWMREGGVARWTLSARNLEGWLAATGATTLTVSLEVLERDGDDLEDARLQSPAQVELSRSASTATVGVELTDDALPEAREEVELNARAAGTTASAWMYIPRNDYRVADFRLSTERAYGREPVYLTAQLNAAAPSTMRVRYRIGEAAPGQAFLPSAQEISIEALAAVGRAELGRLHDFTRGVYRLSLEREQGVFFRDSAGRPVYADGDQLYIPLADGLEEKWLEYERVGVTPTLEWQWAAGAESTQNWEASEGSTATLRLSADSLRPESPLRVELGLSHEEDVRLSTTAVVLSVAAPTAQVEVAVLEDGEPEPYERAVIEIRGLAGEVEFLREAVIHIARHGYRARLTKVTPTEIFQDEIVRVRVELNAPAPTSVTVEVGLILGYFHPPLHYPLLVFLRPAGMEFYEGEGDERHQWWRTLSRTGVHDLWGRLCLRNSSPRWNLDQRCMELEVPQGLQVRVWNTSQILKLEWLRHGMVCRIYEERCGEIREGESMMMRVRMTDFPFGVEEVYAELETGGREDVEIEPRAVKLSARTPTALVEVRVLEDSLAELREHLTLSGKAQLRGREIREKTRMAIPRNGYEAELEFTQEEGSLELRAVVSLNETMSHDRQLDILLNMTLSAPELQTDHDQRLRIAPGETTISYSWEAESFGHYELRINSHFRYAYYPDQRWIPVNPSRATLEVRPSRLERPWWTTSPTGTLIVGTDRMPIVRKDRTSELELHLLSTQTKAVEIKAQILMRQVHRDLDVEPKALRLSPGRSSSGTLRLELPWWEVVPEETVRRLLLSGYEAEGGDYLGSEELRVLMLRGGYTVDWIWATALSTHPVDEFLVEVDLNAPAPWNSTVAVTVKAFAESSERAAAEFQVEVPPGAETGSRLISMREPGLYRFTVATAVFTLQTERGQQELGMRHFMYSRLTVRSLLGDNSSTASRLITPEQRDRLTYYINSGILENVELEGGIQCQGPRSYTYIGAYELHGRTWCLDVTGDRFIRIVDLRLILNYIENHEAIRDGRDNAVRIFEGTELLGNSEEEAWEIIGRIQGFYVRTEENCRALGIDCD